MESTVGQAEHLVVLVHGLWGNPSHLQFLAQSLRDAYNEDQIHVLVVKSSSNNLTYDGIELGGERITHEIENKIQELEETGRKITKFSMIGYSLGGLVARYAVGILFSNGYFDRITPVNFTTFATPHLGVRAPIIGPHSYVWNVLGARTLSASGRQMFLIDNFRDTKKPLLSVMADPTSIFVRGLSSFAHRSLYTNILNDRSVPFYTSCISRTDPFVDLNAVKLHYLPDSNHILLDPYNPVSPRPLPPQTLWSQIRSSSASTIKSLPFYLLLSVVLPIGSVLFLANAGIQSFRSAQRVKLHEAGQAGIGIEKYRRMPPLLTQAQHVADRALRAVEPVDEDYIDTEDEERQDLLGDQHAEHAKTPNGNGNAQSSEAKTESAPRAEAKGSGQFRNTSSFPTLALSDEQFAMIENLDAVGFEKFPVNITAVRHTHAAIIVRSQRKGFEQGKVVIKHWIENFEV